MVLIMKRLLTILVLLPILMRAQTITKLIPAEYRMGYLCSDGVLRAFNNGSTNLVAFNAPSGKTWAEGAGGFNSFLMVTNDGLVYINYNDNTTTFTQYATDSSGATFNGVSKVHAMADTYIALKTNGEVWYWGIDSLHLEHSTGGGNYRPVKISGALTFSKVLIGFFRIVGLTTTGDVYEWVRNSGSITPVQKTIPRPAIDIWTNHYDYAGCLIPKTDGSQVMGYPYVWGTQFGNWGGSTNFTQPTSIATLWSVIVPIKEISSNWNSTHYIDSLNRMWGIAGCNTNGELGNGTEFANKYTYSAPYSWTLADGENPSGAPPVQIGAGVTWSKLYNDNTFFVFYNTAKDASNNYYFWGADKALVSGRGYINLQEATYRNALDTAAPALITPLTAVRKSYNFTLPNIGAGTNQAVALTSTTLAATGHPALLINSANSTDTLAYTVATWAWTKVSGTGGTITSPSSKSTGITGLSNGTYVFQVLMTDNNGGTDTGKVQVVVSLSTTPPTVGAGTDQIITLPTSSTTLTGTASGNGGTTIASTTWTRISGPNTPTIVSPSTLSTSVTGLIAGVYVFQLSATDSNGNMANDQVQVTVNTGTSCNCAGPFKKQVSGH